MPELNPVPPSKRLSLNTFIMADTLQNTERWQYMIILRNIHNKHPKACVWGWYMSCFLQFQNIKVLVQDCSNSTANTLEILQSYTEPMIWSVSHLIIAVLYSILCCVGPRYNSTSLYIELVPRIIHIFMHFCVFLLIYISFSLLTLGQSYACPNASEPTLDDMLTQIARFMFNQTSALWIFNMLCYFCSKKIFQNCHTDYILCWWNYYDSNTVKWTCFEPSHYSDVIMGMVASQITGIMTVYLIICSGIDQRRHQSSASLAFVRGIHWWPVNSPHKGPGMRNMFPFDDVIMLLVT